MHGWVRKKSVGMNSQGLPSHSDKDPCARHGHCVNLSFYLRTGEKNDGCAIFYKKKCFKLEEYSKVEYFRQGDPILNRYSFEF